ncbi:GGDEF domain-containing protein [Spiribacter vilamensis]|uniref:diguanylate cyclase n=1 Tax=Spiribacter vilamensis TaxID=531306 RepID=A0A4Q8CYN3_9GAMM|nr:GGDEF domain-containing protein [Spiribacter vilamensis]RZU98098.1 diguanylate cyclase (GGDEF)-like protein [Spiribacter vilamensis]TVO61000.1 GGDEF domain-containing protein [Spiribacter vilamensis]
MRPSLGVVVPHDDPRQSLRVRRFLLAATVYTLAVALMGFYVRQGLLAVSEWHFLSLVVLTVNAGLYALLRSGRNERFADPSLTGLQMFMVCLLMGVTMYLLDGGRGGLLLLFLVLLMFGVLRLNARQFTALGGFALFCYAVALGAVWHQRPDAFDAQVELLHLAALSTLVPCGGFFASHVSQLRRLLRDRQIDLQRAREEAHDLKVLDPLTGISNRSAIIAFLDQECQRAERLGQPLAVIFMDLIHFKRINREYSHAIGDEILREVARRLRGCVRDIDGLGRYGGEEFLIVLPDATEEEASRVAEKLRTSVESRRFAPLPARQRMRCVVGISSYQSSDTDIWQAIERARIDTESA